ncbi:MAG: hypothetical protein J5632_04510 [Bacteroidales bacterium]|nr:hypothetical protein [Bacteroidales bacterium]
MISLLADFVSAVLLITGAGTMEDLSESEAERFERYASRPLCINLAPRSKLLSSGLMSAYQVASLEDYRSRCGDVLSFAELAAVDGFGREYAQALSLFVSLEASSGGGSFTPVRGSAMVRSSTRSSVNPKGSVKETCSGMKYQIQAGERAEFFLSRRSTYSSPEYGPSTFSAAFYGRRGGKLVAGDFNARFGQGLIMWSGFSMSGFSSVAAFRKNATGVSPTGSFSPSMRGLAGALQLGGWSLSLACDLTFSRGGPGRVAMPAFSLGRLWRNASLGVQGWTLLSGDDAVRPASAASLDWKAGLGNLNIYGECAYSVRAPAAGEDAMVPGFAALAGVVYSPAWKTRLTLLARHYGAGYYGAFAGAVRSSSKVADEDGLSAGAQWRWASLTADSARHPLKGTGQRRMLLDLSPELRFGRKDSCSLVLSPALRCIWRNSPAGRRFEARGDLGASWRGATLKYRYHAASSKGYAWLQYLEAGYRCPGRPVTGAVASSAGLAAPRPVESASRLELSASLRGTIFCVDNWQDRIYCYERDLPGCFSVPAYYGRGYALSALCRLALRHARPFIRHSRLDRESLSIRASLLSYQRRNTFLRRTEFKIQYQLDF